MIASQGTTADMARAANTGICVLCNFPLKRIAHIFLLSRMLMKEQDVEGCELQVVDISAVMITNISVRVVAMVDRS